ncbi:MAG: aldehyde ferredoxin oxidoreductase N-terminal domain-containing protein [Dehalococcoidia bacterium]
MTALPVTQFGYAGKILRVNLSTGQTSEMPTSDYSDRFLGGRGIAAKVYWDEVPPEADAFDPENRLIFATGPMCGVPVIAGSRWTVCAKSPEPVPQSFSYGNLGGRFGAQLKFAGYDAVVVHGKSEKPVYLFLNDGRAELRDASHLWGKGAIRTRENLKHELGDSVRVVAIGPAGENLCTMAVLTADNDAVCTGGVGAVMGSKGLKAIAVSGGKRKVNIAHPERLKELTSYYRDVAQGFTEFLARWSRDIIADFRLVPNQEMKKEPCYGCLGRCPRKVYRAADGRKGKFMCHSAFFYQPHTDEYYGEWNDVPFHACKLCDDYGLDAVAVDLMINWLERCYRAGIVTEQETGLPISRLGSMEFIDELVRKVSLKEDFGEVLARGVEKAAEELGPRALEELKMAGYLDEPGNDIYGPRLYITNAIPYAMEPRVPIQQVHEIGLLIPMWVVAETIGFGHVTTDVLRGIARKFWGGELAMDFSTYDGKALASKLIQDRQYAKECLILCDYIWPLLDFAATEDHVGDPTLESRLLSVVTGMDVDEPGLRRIGERVYNLQRAILVREGRGGRDFDELTELSYDVPLNYDISNPQCLVPGRGGEVVSRRGEVIDRQRFERMKDEYYRLRGWDVATGLQTRGQLQGLGLGEVADGLESMGLLG